MQWMNNEILQAICRTFLHSLWQGMIAAILAGLVLAFTRRTAARTRYNLLGSILLLSLLAAGFTFYLESNTAAGTASGGPYIIVAAPSATSSIAHPGDILLQYMNAHAGLIMLVWLIVFMFRCCRLMSGFYHIRRIRQEASPATAEWSERMRDLAEQLGISQTVRLLETARAQVPFTLGVLKPCIYVPLGLLAQLPADQVETILLHELAHIRRKDYLVNILQNFSDTIFFFNPAMLWISALLREEREACCDDIVVAHTPHQSSYLHALVAFEERAAGIHPGIALMEKQHHLLNRVKRLLTRENKKLSIMEKSILMLGILAVTAFSFIPASKDSVNPVWRSEKLTQTADKLIDTVPARKSKEIRIDTVYTRNHHKKDKSPKQVVFHADSAKDQVVVFHADTVHLKHQVYHVDTAHVKYKVHYTTDTVSHTYRTTYSNEYTVLSIDSTRPKITIYAEKPIKLDTAPVYKVVTMSAPKITLYSPQKTIVLQANPAPAPKLKLKPKPAAAPKQIKKPEPAATPKPQPAKEPKAKKPSKYEPVLPAALLKTMNIGKPQEEC
ncbi:M56 family metallopeptidase [Chitinophaga cymbidii]|uniref:Peptidase M56 domain-containing protein n=1 Tax=Chitinophaga cymbidii TaxID=1096750 RepID=A0A512RK97_9BACT|nr:M56 family metallopeptidase [Chitinophaga cymbidii]GEP96146.1 hypothetical protein CCY01nite_24060 [Chitinophaga cymbidii]